MSHLNQTFQMFREIPYSRMYRSNQKSHGFHYSQTNHCFRWYHGYPWNHLFLTNPMFHAYRCFQNCQKTHDSQRSQMFQNSHSFRVTQRTQSFRMIPSCHLNPRSRTFHEILPTHWCPMIHLCHGYQTILTNRSTLKYQMFHEIP